MPDALLATKLYIPSLRPERVERPRLLARLDLGLQRGMRLLLISAPAGYGKTTLVREWIEHQGCPAAWITLDEADNDTVRFLHYLITALQSIQADGGADALALLHASQGQNTADVLTILLNALAAAPQKRLVVLDDYHAIQLPAIHEAVTFFAEHLPPQVHLVIASRADPPLPLPRLRSRGQIVEIRQRELRFTADEAAAFLENSAGIELPAEQVAALHARTEGWVSGLQLAAISLQNIAQQKQTDAVEFIQNFTGSDHYILDYLIEEVLQRQSEPIQKFLVYTSVLNQLCGPLCDAILQTQLPIPSQQVLENLEHANLFIVPLDNHRGWYRYHHLFLDLLNQRLQQLYPQEIPGLQRAACEWYAQNGFAGQAIEHAQAAGAYSRAAELIEKSTETLLMRGEVLTFLRWVEHLPAGEIAARPRLNLYYAWAQIQRGDSLEAIEAQLQGIEKIDGLGGITAPFKAFLALFKGQFSQASDLSRLALEQLSDDETLLRNMAAFLQATTYAMEGKTLNATQALEEAARASQRAGNLFLATSILCDLAELQRKLGALDLAEMQFRRALQWATDANDKPLLIAGQALAGLGFLAMERNDLEEAQRLLQQAVALSDQWVHFDRIYAYLYMEQLLEVQGDFAGARQMIARLREFAGSTQLTQVDDRMVDFCEARLHLRMGEVALAQQWARQAGLEGDLASITGKPAQAYDEQRLRKYEYAVLAHLWLAQEHYAEALELLQQLAELADQAQRPVLGMEAGLLAALAYQGLGQVEPAAEKLCAALAFGQAHGFMRIFLDQGPAMERLLRTVRPSLAPPALRAYADHLLAAFSPPEAARLPQAEAPGLPEPLSQRELEVLRLLPSSLSSTEMAGRLVVSVNTLRSHLKSLYAKLNAHSRYEAIERAKELHLL